MGGTAVRRRKKHISRGEAVFCFVVGVILGSVFIFVVGFETASVERNDAIAVEAAYDRFYEHKGYRGWNRNIEILFLDHDPLDIDHSCIDKNVRERLETLEKGQRLEMLVQPGSDVILEIKSDHETILDFDEAQKDLSRKRKGFGILGLFLYGIAAYSLIHLIAGRNKRK